MEPLLSYLKCCVVIYMDGGGGKKDQRGCLHVNEFL